MAAAFGALLALVPGVQRRARRLVGFALYPPPPPPTPPTEPSYGYLHNWPEGWWRKRRHTRDAARAAGGRAARVVFLGDSITEQWAEAGRAEWEERFAPLGALNLGVAGDKTQQVLWRIRDGLLVGLSPRVVVLMIGANNLAFDHDRYGPEETARGVAACLAAVQAACPQARVLLLGVPPSGEPPDAPMRGRVRRLNGLLSALETGGSERVRFLDFGYRLLESGGRGRLSPAVAPDGTHLSPAGYRIVADSIEPVLREMLGEHQGGPRGDGKELSAYGQGLNATT
ncbi:MAG TPA: GDSL-type esterase/lipase family protein [Armatimonadaceae bacterium]|nr:GDSL-type esterase/lipase family protein [Armatimonadaceae bacterium]